MDSEALDYRIYVNENFSQKDFDAWVLEELDVVNGGSVLDIGCGSGKHLFKIAEKNISGEVFGTDISLESLNKCKDKIKKDNLKNVFVKKADHTELKEKLGDRMFGRVLSSFAIYYTKNPRKTFKDIHDMMSRSGVLFVCGPHSSNNQGFLELVQNAGISATEDFVKWTDFLEKKAKPLMKETFGNVQEVVFENPIVFPDAETLVKYWRATPLYLEEAEGRIERLAREYFKKRGGFVTKKVVSGLKSVKR